jgi:Zn-dependent membrane protease YugP
MYSVSLLFIFITFLVLSAIASLQLKRRFSKYSEISSEGRKSGREIAEEMLRSHGIYNVRVVSVEGTLSDHYNPSDKTVNLSPDVFHGRNVAAAAVAAHECGHAIQDAHSYSFLKMRSALVPIQNISGTVLNAIFIAMALGAFILPGLLPMHIALQIIIACYTVFTAFAIITLPVEIDASRRALAYLTSGKITNYQTHGYAKDALKWAAYTYVIAALSSLVTLLYYIIQYTNSRD